MSVMPLSFRTLIFGQKGGPRPTIEVSARRRPARGFYFTTSSPYDLPSISEVGYVSPFYSPVGKIEQVSSTMNLVVHGDSISSGLAWPFIVVRSLAAAGTRLDFKIRGIGSLGFDVEGTIGFTNAIVDAAAYIDACRDPTKTNRLCIFFGTNDIGLVGKTGAETLALFNTYIDARLTYGWLPEELVACTMLPRTGGEDHRLTYNNGIMADAGTRGYSKVPLHLNLTIGEDGDNANTTYYSDGLHPTPAGAAIIATEVEAVI